MFTIVKNIVSLLGLPQTLSGSASLSADATLTAAIRSEADGSAVLSATLTTEASAAIVATAYSVITAESNLTAESSLLFPSSSSLNFQSSLESEASIALIIAARPLSGQSELSATMFVPLKVLDLPTVEYVYTEDRLLKRYGITSGQSLTITGTTGQIVEYQTIEEIEAADYYYGGGRRHVLTNTEVTAVQNAGFSDLITTENL